MSHDDDRDEDVRRTRVYREHTPDVLEAFGAFDAAVFADEGRALSLRHRELIAVAVAITTQCVYCIDAHSRRAAEAGATPAELAETAWVATAIRAGGGYAHGRLAFRLAEGHTH